MFFASSDATAVRDTGSDDIFHPVFAAFAAALAFTNHDPSAIGHFHADSRSVGALPTGHVLLQRGQRLRPLPGWSVLERVVPSLTAVLRGVPCWLCSARNRRDLLPHLHRWQVCDRRSGVRLLLAGRVQQRPAVLPVLRWLLRATATDRKLPPLLAGLAHEQGEWSHRVHGLRRWVFFVFAWLLLHLVCPRNFIDQRAKQVHRLSSWVLCHGAGELELPSGPDRADIGKWVSFVQPCFPRLLSGSDVGHFHGPVVP